MADKLQIRTPHSTWMLASVLGALCLHGVCWFTVRIFTGDLDPIGETQRQMTFALGWMVGSVAIWRVTPPSSRLRAWSIALLCAVFVTLLGNVGALLRFAQGGVQFNSGFLTAFGVYRGLKGLGEIALGIPSAIVLQLVALARPKPA
ncbi:MAG: hypothetical protein JF571_00465 [Asticcacaulis sp.]|nr:hypothetical protein [Asticcacaulis sp.]